jgi:hypothetical protein
MGYIWDEEKTRQENGQNSILRICHVTLYAVRMRKVTANASETRQERTKQHFAHCHVTLYAVRMRKVTADASETWQERTKQHFAHCRVTLYTVRTRKVTELILRVLPLFSKYVSKMYFSFFSYEMFQRSCFTLIITEVVCC